MVKATLMIVLLRNDRNKLIRIQIARKLHYENTQMVKRQFSTTFSTRTIRIVSTITIKVDKADLRYFS